MRQISFLLLFSMLSLAVYAQRMMKPSVMVVPSDAWCKAHRCLQKVDEDYYPDYRKAFVENSDLGNVISKINIIMADRGFPLENLETALKSLNTENVERKLYTDADGNAVMSSPLDEIYRSAAADIVLQLSWNINKTGPKRSVTFNLQALDSYTNKQVAGVEGTGAPSFSSDAATLLEEAVVSHMDVFCDRLMKHFQDMKLNGREVSIDFLLGEGSSGNFATEYGDEELSEAITHLIAANAVNHSFSKSPSTETILQYRSVRAPIADEDGMPMDAYAFARKITKKLKKNPYDLSVKTIAKGLGKAVVIIGE